MRCVTFLARLTSKGSGQQFVWPYFQTSTSHGTLASTKQSHTQNNTNVVLSTKSHSQAGHCNVV